MTTISAKVIADSYHKVDERITTLLLRYPRWIHAEGRTHRQIYMGEDVLTQTVPVIELRTPSVMEDPNLSRNASSSRAIPVERMIEDIVSDPAIPLFWGKNQKGMQAEEENTAPVEVLKNSEIWIEQSREDAWLDAMDHAIRAARSFHKAGYHKQIVNRLLEPFSHINVLVTATEWTNFFALRDHDAAEPHIRMLAQAMRKAMDESEPKYLGFGEWHLPFIGHEDEEDYSVAELIRISVARCARLSYMTFEGQRSTLTGDLELYKKLVESPPIHASPAEHQAMPDPYGEYRAKWGNFQHWAQYRKLLPGECL
jgi:Thymidylate synthase complementing protein